MHGLKFRFGIRNLALNHEVHGKLNLPTNLLLAHIICAWTAFTDIELSMPTITIAI